MAALNEISTTNKSSIRQKSSQGSGFLDQILDYLFWMYYIVRKLENAGFQPS